MAFSDYKNITQVQKEFGIKYQQENFVRSTAVAPPDFFVRELDFTINNLPVFRSEPARVEAIIFPILREVYKSYSDKLAFWSHEPIAYDANLCGAPDYLLATQSPLGITVMEKPLLAVVEAKKNDFEQGWGQCLAELVAAQKINEDDEQTLYGMVSDGNSWQFGKLRKNIFVLNIAAFSLGDLPELFGALHFVFRAASNTTLQNK